MLFLVVYPLYKLKYERLKPEFPKVKNTFETIRLLIDSHKSLARFGDGEFNIIAGGGIGFQNPNKKLAIELRRVLESNDDECLIGISDVFSGLSRFRIDAKCFWLYSIVSKWHIWKEFLTKSEYVDTLCSRFYMDYASKDDAPKIVKLWKELWDNRDIVIVEGIHTKMGVGNDLFSNCKSIRRIICPSKDAFSSYEEILNECKKISPKCLILIALGPTASILAYDLSKFGFQAIDTGHIDLEYSWMVNKCHNKEAIEGRYVNEISSNKHLGNFFNKEYEQQIVCKID